VLFEAESLGIKAFYVISEQSTQVGLFLRSMEWVFKYEVAETRKDGRESSQLHGNMDMIPLMLPSPGSLQQLWFVIQYRLSNAAFGSKTVNLSCQFTSLFHLCQLTLAPEDSADRFLAFLQSVPKLDYFIRL